MAFVFALVTAAFPVAMVVAYFKALGETGRSPRKASRPRRSDVPAPPLRFHARHHHFAVAI